MILLIDNYDSFVRNLARYCVLAGKETRVVRNDALNAQDVLKLRPQALVISPGPCAPDHAGNTMDIIRCADGKIPMLGVCLGHQAIGQAFGGRVVPAPQPMHGQASSIIHQGDDLFAGIPERFEAGRYHSLIVELADASNLEVTARDSHGTIMALRHKHWPVFGVQFHPESILTPYGMNIIENFFKIAA